MNSFIKITFNTFIISSSKLICIFARNMRLFFFSLVINILSLVGLNIIFSIIYLVEGFIDIIELLIFFYHKLASTFSEAAFFLKIIFSIFLSLTFYQKILVVSLLSMSFTIIVSITYIPLSITLFSEGVEPGDTGSNHDGSPNTSSNNASDGGSSRGTLDRIFRNCSCCYEKQDTMGPCGCNHNCIPDKITHSFQYIEGICCGCRGDSFVYSCRTCTCTYCNDCYTIRCIS